MKKTTVPNESGVDTGPGEAARVIEAACEQAVARAVEAAERSGRAQLASVTRDLPVGDPLAFFEQAGTPAGRDGDAGDRFYWCRPAAGMALAGAGAAAVVEAKGPDRFADTDRGVADAFARLHGPDAADPARGPVFVGGFAFDAEAPASTEWQAFPAARLVLPAALVRRDASGTRLVVTQRVAPGAGRAAAAAALAASVAAAMERARGVWQRTPDVHPDPPSAAGAPSSVGDGDGEGAEYTVRADRPHDVYRGQVAAALRAIAAGELEKVVLARSLAVRHPGRFDVEAFLAALQRIYPSCTVLAIGSADDTLVAATPELLVRRQGGQVETCAVAGSAPRGRTPEEDDALGRALAESPKEQAEHAAVVRAIRAALAAACGTLEGAAHPELLRLEGIQHLATLLAGRLQRDGPAPSVIALGGALHPTPAVAGLPDAAARAWIAEHEGLDRGWYAAPVGWVDARGDGELQVALRSALVRNAPADAGEPNHVSVSHARLFAGAGIVAGSDPDQELRETRLKLRALLAPLTEI